MPESRAEQTKSIGHVLGVLKADFPDISISKIRFLESEGLISPHRAPSGYRRYTDADVERLRYVLSVQRSHYLPLRVIREHLDQMDRGQPPPALDQPLRSPDAPPPTPPAVPSAQSPTAAQPATPGGQAGAAAKPPVRLTRAELLDASGLSEAALAELERNQIIQPRRGATTFGRDALTIAIAARRLGEYGIDGRHLRAFKISADREVGLVEQAIAPHVRRAGGNKDVSGEVTQLVISFHAALVRTAMER
jgi:DNA-binding transcriptional MerR regulator